ncbi:MAG: hypothetical protein HDP34_00495 [Clostridia bacterium]|nr:hypothetical protein [Clostridia bacterium]
MGKIKSAIITAFLVAAIIVLALFATISCNVPGTNGVKRYNSFISNIRLGSSLTGEAYALLYPEGVISSADYDLVVNDSENADSAKYPDKYTSCGGLYVEKDKLGESDDFKNSVASDARIIADRFGKKGYTVSVEDDYSIKVSVPTNFNYAAFSGKDATARSNALSEISHTVKYLMLDGGLSLRDGTEYDSSKSLLSIREDISTYFKSISFYSMAGQYAVRMNLTNEGFDKLNAVITAGESGGTAYFYIGETNLNLTMSLGSDKALTEKTMLYSADKSYAEDFAILLKSVVNGNKLVNSYSYDSNTDEPLALTPVFGEYAAIYLLVAMLLVIAGAIAGSVIKYKKLGLVNAIMVLIYALVIVTATMLIGIQLTIAGAFVAALGLALMCFTNFRVFEAVRAETATGRTIQASVKLGYKKTLFTILDLHVVLLVAALMLTLIGVGEVSACGFIFFIATICSYVLYWFTRLMWFVISSPVKDKFKFCGYKREVLDDED